MRSLNHWTTQQPCCETQVSLILIQRYLRNTHTHTHRQRFLNFIERCKVSYWFCPNHCSISFTNAFRKMTRVLNPEYNPPSREALANHLIPAWYQVERENLQSTLKDVKKAAITADGWTSLAQDHYITVTVHFVKQGKIIGKVQRTKAVYEVQTGAVVAEEIKEILQEFSLSDKVVAATVDNAINMNVALKQLPLIKIGCFVHTLNLAAQKIHQCNAVTNWAARARAATYSATPE